MYIQHIYTIHIPYIYNTYTIYIYICIIYIYIYVCIWYMYIYLERETGSRRSSSA